MGDDRLEIIRRQIEEDRDSGKVRPIAEYSAMFAGEDALVGRAYADVLDVRAVGSVAVATKIDGLGHAVCGGARTAAGCSLPRRELTVSSRHG